LQLTGGAQISLDNQLAGFVKDSQRDEAGISFLVCLEEISENSQAFNLGMR
jgi:hypothetical protein